MSSPERLNESYFVVVIDLSPLDSMVSDCRDGPRLGTHDVSIIVQFKVKIEGISHFC